jgi:hypothetical protein
MITASFTKALFERRVVDKFEPVTLDSVFRIASTAKAVTGQRCCSLLKKARSISSNRWATYCR